MNILLEEIMSIKLVDSGMFTAIMDPSSLFNVFVCTAFQ